MKIKKIKGQYLSDSIVNFDDKEIEMIVKNVKFLLDIKNLKVKNFDTPFKESITLDTWMKNFYKKKGWQVDYDICMNVIEILQVIWLNNTTTIQDRIDTLTIKLTEQIDRKDIIIKELEEQLELFTEGKEVITKDDNSEEDNVENDKLGEVITDNVDYIDEVSEKERKKQDKKKKEQELLNQLNISINKNKK